MKMTTTISVARALSARYGIEVRMQGDKAYTDGKMINIPDLGSDIDDRKLALLRGYIDHEAGGHGRHTDFGALNTGKIEPEVLNLCNAIEDIRVEALLGREFEGCRNNLARLNDSLIADLEKRGKANAPDISLIANGFKLLAGQSLANVPDIAFAKEWFGEDIMERVAACKSTGDALNLARSLVAGLKSRDEKEKKEKQERQGEPESGDGDDAVSGGKADEPNDAEGEGKDGPDVQDAGSEGEGESGDQGGAGEGKEKDGENWDGEPEKAADGAHGDGRSDLTAAQVLESLRGMRNKGEALGEMLSQEAAKNAAEGGYSVYSKEGDRIEPVEEAPTDAVYRSLREGLGSLNTMKAKVARAFQSEKAIRWIGDRDRGRINNRALCRVAVGNGRVFKERLESRHVDTAATFLVDFSGSMNARSGGARRIDHAMSAVVLFLEALEQAGVASEVLGYTTRGIMPSYFRDARSGGARRLYGRIDMLMTYVFKSFGERMGAKVRRRISAYDDCELLENCDADSLRIAYERIMQRKERRKIIFVLTDGAVCASGDNEAGREELKRLAGAIERQGKVELVAVDFLTGMADGYYSKVIMVHDGKDLAEKLLDGLKRFLF